MHQNWILPRPLLSFFYSSSNEKLFVPTLVHLTAWQWSVCQLRSYFLRLRYCKKKSRPSATRWVFKKIINMKNFTQANLPLRLKNVDPITPLIKCYMGSIRDFPNKWFFLFKPISFDCYEPKLGKIPIKPLIFYHFFKKKRSHIWDQLGKSRKVPKKIYILGK